jgi:hypothetical protein
VSRMERNRGLGRAFEKALALLALNPCGMPTTRMQTLGDALVSANLSSRNRRGRTWKHLLTGWAQLSEVGLHHIDNLISRERLLRIRSSLWVKHMMPDVAFQELSH